MTFFMSFRDDELDFFTYAEESPTWTIKVLDVIVAYTSLSSFNYSRENGLQ